MRKLNRKKHILISMGRFRTPGLQFDAVLDDLKPAAKIRTLAYRPFTMKYVRQLIKLGIFAVAGAMDRLQPKSDESYCCHDDAPKGEKKFVFCDNALELTPALFDGGGFAPRRVFAVWWDAQAGEGVPELTAPITTSSEPSRKKEAGL